MYVAHRRETSNALNASVRGKRNVFRNCLKLFPRMKMSGREFQTDGPATQKAHRP